MFAVPGTCSADEDEVYESMYGSVASLYSTGYGIAFDNLKEGQRLEPYIDKINKIAGFAATVGSATRKAASGDMYGAGEESILAIMAEVAGWESSGQAYLKYLGLSTATFQFALTAYSITKESYAQVESTRIARDIESLYGTIESDPVLKPKTGRKLGDKSDPIPVTKQSVEYVFRKVLQDTNWRNKLKLYVTEELGRDFPEPSTWEWLNIITVDGGRGSDMAVQSEILKNRQEVETWIAGLLKRLNDYARAAESEVIMRKAFIEIEKASKKITPEFVNYTVSIEEAIKRLPEIDTYAKQVPQAVANSKKDKKWDDLYNIRDRIGYFVRVYVRILPDTGPVGQKKKEVKIALKQSWSSVASALKDIPKTIQNEFTTQVSAPKYSTSLSLSVISPNLITIDEASMRLHQAKTIQVMETEAKTITEDTKNKYKTFQEQYYKANPSGNDHPAYISRRDAIYQTIANQRKALEAQSTACGGYTQARDRDPNWQKCVNDAANAMRAWEQTAWKPMEDLEVQRKNYDEKRGLYAGNVELQFNTLLKAIGRLTNEERVRFADMAKLKNAALEKVAAVNSIIPISYPAYPAYPPPVNVPANYQNTAEGTKQLLNGLLNLKIDSGYLGLPKMKFPAWGENGAAVVEYIEDIRKKIVNESNNSQRSSAIIKYAMEYIERLKKHLVEKDRYAQEVAEAEERIYALNLQSDPKALVLTDMEKKIAGMKDVEKLMLEVEATVKNKVAADNDKQLAGIQDDLAYLDSLRKKVRYWSDMVQMYSTPLYKFGGSVNAVMVSVAMATEGSSGSNRRIFLASSPSDTNLFDRAKANAAADALLREVVQTGIAKWDPNGDTGLKAMLEKKAAEIRNYYIDSPDYAIVNGNVIYASRISKMATDVKAIPTSSYGTYTYKEGIRNRTFDEKLGAVLRNGTAFAMDIEMKTNSDEQSVAVSLDTVKGLAANHRNAAIKTASSDLVKAVDEHVKRYNAHTAEEAKQRAIDYAKSEAEMKLQNECLAKGGVYTNGKCTTTPGGPGQAGRPGQPGQTGQPGQLSGMVAGTPPTGMGAGNQPTGAGHMTNQAGTPPAAMPQSPTGQAKAPGQPGLPTTAYLAGTGSAITQTGIHPSDMPQATGAAKIPGTSAGGAPPALGMSSASPATGIGQSPSASAKMKPPSGYPAEGTPKPQTPETPVSRDAAKPAQPSQVVMASTTPITQQPSVSPPKTGGQLQTSMGNQNAGQPPAIPAMKGPSPQEEMKKQQETMKKQQETMKKKQEEVKQQEELKKKQQETMKQKIKEMYNTFKDGYQTKNDSKVIGCLSSQWTGSDGASIADVQRALKNSFNKFDQVQYNISNLNITHQSGNIFRVSYSVNITGRISTNNLKHEEKSNINDLVTVDDKGTAKITKTLSGIMVKK